MTKYDTNLAAEYYVLSCLHRCTGISAALTLGNKKGVDILVARDAGEAVTVEVKGLAGKGNWIVGKLSSKVPENHFVALVSFEGTIADPEMPPPSVWIIPFSEIPPFIKQYGAHIDAVRTLVINNGTKYRNAWHLITGERAG